MQEIASVAKVTADRTATDVPPVTPGIRTASLALAAPSVAPTLTSARNVFARCSTTFELNFKSDYISREQNM